MQGSSNKIDMKHNKPSIVPIAHTAKCILALLLACGATSSQCYGNPAVAAVVISAIGLGAELVVKTSSFYGSEVGTVSAQLHDYYLESVIEYPISGQIYIHRWHVCKDYKGNFSYSYQMFENGAVLPGSPSASPFSLGGQNGYPLTKLDYNCQRITPNSNSIISSKSTMTLKVSHTVDQPGGYFYTPPDRVTVNLNFDANRLSGTCDGQTLTGISKTSSCSVLRNGSYLWSYPHVNYEVVGGNMTAD